ncbi:di-heme-cytochrome C peroxidase [Paracraurococcus lichenis]|uniref:Di-heme-cytochrome C peroxidase n=1 Tax=Paracraurococcus lichenis TaxID=3064888 RepID=A0ABT9EDW0_9PROT|nr:di-heme-cytochrome C peroxidase [Paracraurococcus sp. LOR1-02]MDO9714284.1 di-heme-cytochrome C peroxidase [Paracraurococcus sp. LOR1-02]
MRQSLIALGLAVGAASCTPPPRPVPLEAGTLDQGPAWTEAARADFYTRDQGSQLMPAAWLMALQDADGQPFMRDRLARYGYLPNRDAPTSVLPVGFSLAGPPGGQMVGMSCAACHTREIEAEGRAWRVDGGPAFADFQSFLADLDRAVGALLANPAAFDTFAVAVLGNPPAPADKAALQQQVERWYRRYHTIIARSLPTPPWGPGRLDAVAMIFNRLTGLDLGPPPDYLIPANIRVADAPVRYPFLWNAAKQDKTQWPGFADNGNDVLALARNLGEVLGVFATFHPVPDPRIPLLGVNYVAQNSANFDGLLKLEDLLKRIGPPRYPFAVDQTLVAQGRAIFARDPAQGGCAGCHDIKPGAFRGFEETWATPIQDVGTDSREVNLLARTAQSGVLEGHMAPLGGTLKAEEPAVQLLGAAVFGSILQAPFATDLQRQGKLALAAPRDPRRMTAAVAAAKAPSLEGAYPAPQRAEAAAATPGAAYEARVMQGIWATAPYLHNGSVPTLADLLKPAAARPAEFSIGPAYDTTAVGLARVQPGTMAVLRTTGCEDRDSGNSRCGHEFGTTLTDDEKRALLEYLKTL